MTTAIKKHGIPDKISSWIIPNVNSSYYHPYYQPVVIQEELKLFHKLKWISTSRIDKWISMFTLNNTSYSLEAKGENKTNERGIKGPQGNSIFEVHYLPIPSRTNTNKTYSFISIESVIFDLQNKPIQSCLISSMHIPVNFGFVCFGLCVSEYYEMIIRGYFWY